MKTLRMGTILVAGLAVALLFPGLSMVDAATGSVGGQGDSRPPCPSGIGVGSAFDGTNLWYSCSASSTDLYRAGTDGVITASYRIDGGLGALVYDPARNGIWASWGGGAAGAGVVWFIALNAGKHVVGSTLVGNVSEGILCDLNDGLAYDRRTDSLYFSNACSRTIHRYAVVSSSPPAVGAHLYDVLPSGHVNTVFRPDSRASISISGKSKDKPAAPRPINQYLMGR